MKPQSVITAALH